MMTKRYIVGLVWCDECYSKVELRRHYRWLHELVEDLSQRRVHIMDWNMSLNFIL